VTARSNGGGEEERLGYVGGLPTLVLLWVVSYSVYWELPITDLFALGAAYLVAYSSVCAGAVTTWRETMMVRANLTLDANNRVAHLLLFLPWACFCRCGRGFARE
jgi:hypothetical protein